MRILITGGAGFIGANLASHLLSDERVSEVRILDDLSTGSTDNLDLVRDAAFIEGSVLDSKIVDLAVSGVDSIIHLAARPSVPRSVADPRSAHEINVTGSLNILEAARSHDRIHTIVASSSSVYGANPSLPKHENLVPQPVSPYAASKLAAESYALAWQRTYGLPTLAFRFFNVYGPLQSAGHAYAAAIPTFIDAALHGLPIPLHGDGNQSRDFTFVHTVTEVLAQAAIEQKSHPDPVNLAFGTRVSLNDVIAGIASLIGREVEVEHLPSRVGDVKHSQADNATLLRLFAHIQPIEFLRGLQMTVEWFLDRGPVH